uniref:Uncharacterized protein n=1 Tax=Timema poppense TaxID=170557 RepID=A0A7R9H9B8_TIMPO|nr:unnamed protein product [Timema poppensis]
MSAREAKEEELDEFNIHVARHRPEELTKLAKTTKFTRKEIQLMYRGFKQNGFRLMHVALIRVWCVVASHTFSHLQVVADAAGASGARSFNPLPQRSITS